MEYIASAQNTVIKWLKSLHTPEGRKAENAFLVEGEHLAQELLKSDARPLVVMFDDAQAERYASLAAALGGRGARVFSASGHCVKAASDTVTPQGIVAAAEIPLPLDYESARRVLALDGVQDPGNVGTLLRVCGAAGFDGVLLSRGCADAYSPKCVRASMGAALRVPVYDCARLPLCDVLVRLKQCGLTVIASTVDGEGFFERAPAPSVALVVGSEGSGVSGDVLAVADLRLALPMARESESLNAATAGAIMIYDWVRRGD